MAKLELLPVHEHPLLLFTRFHRGICNGCSSDYDYCFYGGYICNTLGCNTVFHRKCVESAPKINHSYHPNHPLEIVFTSKHILTFEQRCSLCEALMNVGYSCSICDFRLHLECARKPIPPLHIDLKVHDHALQLSNPTDIGLSLVVESSCRVCNNSFLMKKSINDCLKKSLYQCLPCKFFFHVECVEFVPQGYHTSHPKHPLKFLTCGPPNYSDKKCLLCEKKFEQQLYHCDVCNFSICIWCMRNPPPVGVVSLTTHEHTLHLVPRIINFTCNACGTQGDRSPYFCLRCNFMVHRNCIDLPRVININRHDHRISYISHLGLGNWTCGVCRKNVDGFYGGYSCLKCHSYVVHSRCATREDIWDKVELEGTTEEIEDMEPFEVINDYTIKHFSHNHDLKINRNNKILRENILCEACLFQIYDESFYSCEQCDFILHETCANLRPKKRHVANNIPFTLIVGFNKVSPRKQNRCHLCKRHFTGYKYISSSRTLDVRCGSFSEPFFHESHPHPLYYKHQGYWNRTINIEHQTEHMLCCDECPFTLNFWWAFLPKKVMNKRYDDHPLFLSYGENNVSSIYWCDVCETKLDPKEWFYTCDDCGITLHVSCVVGDFSFHKLGSIDTALTSGGVVVANTSIRRPCCFKCGLQCIVPFILKFSQPNADAYICSYRCHMRFFKEKK